MSRGYAEKEREFLESLKADTGRDLGEWMAAITAAEFAHRNEVIDWLRQQGFLFSWASWLERIHHNGGRPIYYDEAVARALSTSSGPGSGGRPADVAVIARDAGAAADAAPARASVAKPEPADTCPPASRAIPVEPRPASASANGLTSEVKAVVASAKAFAPLTGFLLRRILDAVPDAQFAPGRKQITALAGGEPFALVAIAAKDVKLCFAGPPGAVGPPAERVRLAAGQPPAPVALTHMLSLADAREVSDEVTAQLREAAARIRKN